MKKKKLSFQPIQVNPSYWKQKCNWTSIRVFYNEIYKGESRNFITNGA
jgi:hypothetical protein